MTKKISPDKRMAFATIYVKYPNWKMVAKLNLPDRKKFRDEFLKANFQKLIDKKYFDTYELVGTKRRPSGVKAKLTLASILKLTKQTFIDNIFIYQIEGAKEKPDKPIYNFFCVKMTVSIQVEGFTKGMQSCEDRYVLVKASSVESAYTKVKKQGKQYGEPYLNSDARLVRWKIESYDDCFATDITSIDDFNKPEGVEVFSKLKSRKITSDRTWNGK
jgi:hypothetical protein